MTSILKRKKKQEPKKPADANQATVKPEDTVQKPDVGNALDAIDRALAETKEKEVERHGCGCGW